MYTDHNLCFLLGPHFEIWGGVGVWCDFHGQCDLVCVDSPEFGVGVGLTVHIRSSPRCVYSHIETAAIKNGGDVLDIGAWGEFFWNGEANSAAKDADFPNIKAC